MTPELYSILGLIVTGVISALAWLTKSLVTEARNRVSVLQKIVDDSQTDRKRLAEEQVIENRALRIEITGLRNEATGLRIEIERLKAVASARAKASGR